MVAMALRQIAYAPFHLSTAAESMPSNNYRH